MVSADPRLWAGESRERVLQQVAELAAAELAGMASASRVLEFCRHYFKHAENSALLTRPPAQIVAGLLRQARSAWRRAPGQTRMELFTPHLARHGWEAAGHTVLTVVTDDKPWLVDTVLQAVNARGWSVRELVHPQFGVIRGAHGELLDMAHRAEQREMVNESWLWVELYPPLGSSAEEEMPRLTRAIEAGLADLDAATGDQKAMQQAMLDAASAVERLDHADRAPVAELLRWLAADRFLVLGSRDFDLQRTPARESRLVPRPGGLGILRDEGRADTSFGAVPQGRELLVITKDSSSSRVQRSDNADYLGVQLSDGTGRYERRFIGLFAPAALTESVHHFPLLRDKAEQVKAAIGYDPDSHGGRAVAAALEALPRELMLQAEVAELIPIIAEIAGQDDPRRVISFLRPSRWGRFLTALIYFPRERYNTAVRERVENLLLDATGAQLAQRRVQVTSAPLARLSVSLQMPAGEPLPDLDQGRLSQAIEEVSRDWNDRFMELAERLDSAQRGVEWSDSYKEQYSPLEAINDLVALNQVSGPGDMAQIMYVPSPPENGVDFRLKMLRVGSQMVLSEILPHLASLGVEVIDERPFELELRQQLAHVFDFGLRLPGGPERLDGWSYEARHKFTSAVAASYSGLSVADGLNLLVTDADLSWEQVSLLRAISRYLRQLGTTYSQPYIAAILHKHVRITAKLLGLFEAKFDPWLPAEDRDGSVEEATAEVRAAIDKVEALDDDRILRQYLAVIEAMVRTNFYALTSPTLPSGTPQPGRGALAFKVHPGDLGFLAGPQPEREVFVYSPRVEGVHLRYGPVARGGLRWSDRAEDYRTEVLGLVRTQMEKNSIIVPVGAKGGFHPLRLSGPDPVARAAEGRAAYAEYIRALLSITDNIADGEVVHPARMVVWDEADPYLVVAADKGTASFSDLANRIAVEQGFWLGDAFASGGSEGYDHKQMGITARGAWVSVERHLTEMGLDPRTQDFTCVGIGDMAGDVFGNGMLRSPHTRLVAAFNHQHIFCDPDPDAARSFEERARLFAMARSTWADYDQSLISPGGGVYARSAKSIPVNAEVRAALGLPEGVSALTPNEMIRAILRAPVDLMWNGGIGTWVKASHEEHSEVGDRSNDAVRVDANQVRARAVGEGGNLGWTKAGRVEYALAGGRINTDSVDNSAGVHTSDYEVNIKILLDAEVTAGRLDEAERNALLQQMTDEVAELVLDQNLMQNRALATSLYEAAGHAGVHEELMAWLEGAERTDRGFDGLPSTEELAARAACGGGLSGPELCVLQANVKNALAEEILATDLPEDPYLGDRLIKYFPTPLRERFTTRMPDHRLARQIITTVAVNRFVDSQGISAAHRLREETGAGVADVIRAQLAARHLTDAGSLETRIAALELPAATRTKLRVRVRRMVERATRWLLQAYPSGIDIEQVSGDLKPGVRQVIAQMPELFGEATKEQYQQRVSELVADGVDESFAARWALWPQTHFALPIVAVAAETGREVSLVGGTYFVLSEALGIDRALAASLGLPQDGRWDIMARAAVRDELVNAQAAVTRAAINLVHDTRTTSAEIVARWWDSHPNAQTVRDRLVESTQGEVELSRMMVGLGAVRSLV